MNKKEHVCAISCELAPLILQDKITQILDKAVEITKHTLAAGEPAEWARFAQKKERESTHTDKSLSLVKNPVYRTAIFLL